MDADWLGHETIDPQAELRLFCLPYAGGGAAAFREWRAALPRRIHLTPLELPGRGRRMTGAPFSRMGPLVRALTRAIEGELDRPYALFGHSMGGLIAFEVARELRRRSLPAPLHLFVSAVAAPGTTRTRPVLHSATDAEVREELRFLGGTPKELLENQELMDMMIPTLRADFSVLETYEYRPEPPLDVPLTAFGGTADPSVQLSALQGWRDQSTRARLTAVDGDHFFLHSARTELLAHLTRTLDQELTAHRGRSARQETPMPTPGPAAPAAPQPFALLSPGERAALPAGAVDAFPLTGADPAGPAAAGNRTAAWRLTHRKPFAADALRAAADEVLARHELLRLARTAASAAPLHVVHATARAEPALHDHREVTAATRADLLTALRESERTRPFDPEHPPLLRLHAVLEPDNAWLLLVTLHPDLAALLGTDALLTEVLRAYERQLTGAPAPAGPLRHAACAAAARAGRLDRAGRAHWREATTAHPPFALPRAWADRSAAPAPAAATVPYADLEGGLAALATAAGVPLTAVLCAAHVAVLSRLTAETAFHTDVVVRADAGEEGCAAALHRTTLPVAVERPATTWRDLAAHVHERERAAWRHRHAHRPAAGPAADAAAEPPVHARFAAEDRQRTVSDTQVTALDEDPAPTGHGLTVVAGDGLLHLRAHGGACTPDRAERLGRMYRSVLESMAADPDGAATGAHLDPEERTAVLTTWATAPAADRGPGTVVDLLRAQAARTPDAVAVRVGDTTLTYREVDERSERIAHHLLGLGARPDTLIGVCLRRTPDLLPALLGVWKSGAGYLPLDPSLPTERLRQMLDATGCPAVLTTAGHRERLTALYDGPLVELDTDRAAIGALPATPPEVTPAPGDLAYIIYTSGSTGAPKGVQIEHRGLLNYLGWTVGAYAAHGTGGAPVFSSLSFDLGIPNLFTPLLTGQPVHLLPDPFDTADLGAHLAAGAPYSFIKMTPGHLDLLTYQLTAEQIRSLAGICIAAGDSFSSALAARWQELAGPGGTLVATEYGPTEITIGNSGQIVDEVPASELVPLGRPIPNTTMYVLTDRLEPVPAGVPGEVYIGGDGVARGYLGRDDLTAERFLPDPFGAPDGRLYRTGDLARWAPDGSLEFLGRIDNQVKIRGYRVELGEIEAALRRHPQVRDAVAVVREATPGNPRLYAYVVPAQPGALDSTGIRDRLAGQLPPYMVPADCIALDAIPLTANGKVDVRALPPAPC
ncbi:MULTISPECIES: amino acid adenylation domain-containing protein [Streptomyces]|uniref:Amino acid adenylation domain-containing protein n=1 Tax=Streptomyces ramulosus TaxID=47762 RepID=A0ABW1FBC6_9ACTN